MLRQVNHSTKTVFASANKTHRPLSAVSASKKTYKPSAIASVFGANLVQKTTFAGFTVAGFSGQKRFKSSYASRTHADVFTPPDISEYKQDVSDQTSNKAYAYFMVGGLGTLGAVTAKNTVTDYLVNLAASADVLALATVEVDLATIPEGKNIILKWRGKPVTIRHRTADEIQEANSVNIAELRHPELDTARTKKQEWLVMLAVCTHLGCVPIGEAGEFGGWFCPCHGSHYDISGRIRKGPAPLNLEIPEYSFSEDESKVRFLANVALDWIAIKYFLEIPTFVVLNV